MFDENFFEADEEKEFMKKFDGVAKQKMLDLMRREMQAGEHLDNDSAKEKKVFLGIMYAEYAKGHEFKEGDMVKWKHGMKNKRFPRYGEPCVVLTKYTTPVTSTIEDAGSPFFREQLDVVLAFIDTDGEFLAYHFDSKRFEPFA